MSRFVRSSHYRHVYAERSKNPYDNAKISGSAWDTNLVTAGAKYIAVNWQVSGGGAFAILPTFSEFNHPKPEGFNTKLPDTLPLARGHTAPVLDTAWSPFDDNLVVSGGEDGKIFIWKVEDALFDGWKEEGWEPVDLAPSGKLNAGGRKVGQVEFHPAASNVLASASGDHLVRVWDIEGSSDEATIALKGHNDTIQSLCWNAVGSMIATTCRDRKLRLFDPRAGSEAVRVTDGHGGIKGSRVVWLGDRDRIATTGFSKMSDRQLSLWETGGLTNLETESLDTSAGVVMPYFAEGNNVLFLAGKGDGNIRYFELENDKFHFLSQYTSSTPQRGLNFIPRRGLDISQKEIARAFKLSTNSIEALSFIVPRKAEGFQSDIFPPANSDEPALSAGDWFGGKTARPNMVDLETRSVSANKTPISTPTPKASAPVAKSATSTAAASPAPASPVIKEEPKKEQTPPKEEPKEEPKPAPKAEEEPKAKDLEIEQSDDSEDEATVSAAVGGGVTAAAVGAAAAVPVSQSTPTSKPTTQPPSGAATPAKPAPNTSDDLLVKLLSDKATLPTRGSALSAGYDLYAAEDTVIPARGKALVDTQLSIAVPTGTYGRIAPRSGLASKHSIDTGAGVIDADYRGTVFVLLFNYGDNDFSISRGDRVAQLILEKVHMAEIKQVDDLEATARGSGGFGSTGGYRS